MTSLPPRPKPWETSTSNATVSSSKPVASAFDNALATTSTMNGSSSNAPQLPERPAGLDGTVATSGEPIILRSFLQCHRSELKQSIYGMASDR